MGGFEGWLNALNVLYAGDPASPQLGWLRQAGAHVTLATSSEQAQNEAIKDANAFDVALVDADLPSLGWVSVARDVPRSCSVIVLSDRADASMLESVSTLRAEFISRSASEADLVFKLKNASRLSVPSMRRLAANATKLWGLPRQLSRLLYYNLWSYSDQEIADAMGLSRHTIQEYQDELRRRTGVRTKHAYLRRLLEYAGEEPPLSMSDNTRAHVTQYRRREEEGLA